MAASRNDQYLLSQNAPFQNRVQASLISACVAIQTESPTTTVYHRERSNYVSQILGSATVFSDAVLRHSFSAATDTNVIADATQGGTVVLTPANVAAQAALVTDAHIDTAISTQFDTFFRAPGF